MKIFIFNYKILLYFLLNLIVIQTVQAQDTSIVIGSNTIRDSFHKMNMDAIYNRPFQAFNKTPIAIGGYLEANTEYASLSGINDGLNFQMRRLTLFFSSTVGKKVKFLSEIEFEDGTKEINLETALLDPTP